MSNSFDPYKGPFQVLLLRTRVDLAAMAIKDYYASSKATALLKPHIRLFSLISSANMSDHLVITSTGSNLRLS